MSRSLHISQRQRLGFSSPAKPQHWLVAIALCAPHVSQAEIANPKEAYASYTVARGDHLEQLATRLLIEPKRWAELARLNGLKNPSLIYPGQVLDIPRSMLNFDSQTETVQQAVLLSVSGDVTLNGQKVAAGASIPVDAKLQTGPNSSAVLRLTDGSQVQLMPRSLAEVARQGSYQLKDTSKTQSTTWYSAAMRLVEGALDVVANQTALRARPLGVMTPTSVVGVRGTTFRVAFDDPRAPNARTEVLEGRVQAAQLQARQVSADVNKGFGVAMKPNDREVRVVPLLPALPQASLPASIQRTADESGAVSPAVWTIGSLPGASGYKLEIAQDKEFAQLVAQIKSASPSIDVSPVPNGRYHARVRGFDAAGIEGYNAFQNIEISTLKIVKPLPWIPTIHEGATLENMPTGNLRLRVQLAQPAPEQLWVELAQDKGFTQSLQRIAVDPVAGALLPALNAGEKRYVRFVGQRSSGQTEISPVSVLQMPGNWQHTVFGVMDTLQLTSP